MNNPKTIGALRESLGACPADAPLGVILEKGTLYLAARIDGRMIPLMALVQIRVAALRTEPGRN